MKIEFYGEATLECSTVLEGLAKRMVLHVEKDGERFRVAEGCDNYYAARLTPAQLAVLGKELIELSETVSPDREWQVGDRVIVRDFSEAQGEAGAILHIQSDGLILVELDSGCVWLVEKQELESADS